MTHADIYLDVSRDTSNPFTYAGLYRTIYTHSKLTHSPAQKLTDEMLLQAVFNSVIFFFFQLLVVTF